jgi:HKD family nuclease
MIQLFERAIYGELDELWQKQVKIKCLRDNYNSPDHNPFVEKKSR